MNPEGWQQPVQPRLGGTVRWHYFRERQSLCRRYEQRDGASRLVATPTMGYGRKRCAVCRTKLEKGANQ